MVIVGNVVQEYKIGNAQIRICDDFCSKKTNDDIEAILHRISKNALGPLSNVTSNSNDEDEKILFEEPDVCDIVHSTAFRGGTHIDADKHYGYRTVQPKHVCGERILRCSAPQGDTGLCIRS